MICLFIENISLKRNKAMNYHIMKFHRKHANYFLGHSLSPSGLFWNTGLHIELGRFLQPLSAGNSTEFSQADNLKTIQHRGTNLTSLDSLGSCESIYVHFKPKKLVETN